MYSKRASLVLGFHDWLGSGVYFWANNHARALEFANFLKDNPPHNSKQNVEEPSVIRKPNCIKGYFIPLDLDSKYALP